MVATSASPANTLGYFIHDATCMILMKHEVNLKLINVYIQNWLARDDG